MNWVMLLKDLKRSFVFQSLMGPLSVVIHFPQSMLIPSMFRIMEALTRKAFFVVGAVASLDDAILPWAAFLDQSVNAFPRFHNLGKSCFAFGMSGIAHCEIHGVVGKSYEKGGRLSNAR